MSRPLHVLLAGNPNVGKSTVFNTLTGLHQHTGNWTGKTVALAQGHYVYKGREYLLSDLFSDSVQKNSISCPCFPC